MALQFHLLLYATEARLQVMIESPEALHFRLEVAVLLFLVFLFVPAPVRPDSRNLRARHL